MSGSDSCGMCCINRAQVTEKFQSYVENYDQTDTKIALKVEHTYHVANISEQLAQALLEKQNIEQVTEMPGQEVVDLAWLIGMLHDLGRFEQLRQYGTFIDEESIDHAQLALDILFRDGMIRSFVQESKYDAVIKAAVGSHSAYRISENLDEKTVLFCNLIRDADKIDIFRSSTRVPMEEIYNTPEDGFYTSEISPEVLEAFYSGDTVLRSLKKTPVDYLVGLISLINGLVFPYSSILVLKQGYFQKMLDFPSENKKTKQELEKMKQYIQQKYGRMV
ncbi:MAG: HD domain-containing protein [Lachnospiraceae bacterium]|nr:HD domain-containing protein [Lachnospiraceae bacterium]